MKEIKSSIIEELIYSLFLNANYTISDDIFYKIRESAERETSESGKSILNQIFESYQIAREEKIAICQDTGMALVFAEVGQDVHILGDFEKAINKGVARAYREGYLRASVVKDPIFERVNTKDNTPAIIYTKLVVGDTLKLTAVAKGFGSENCSRSRMFLPMASQEEIENFIIDTVLDAGSRSCPPVIVGVGIGGTIDKAALMAKMATARSIDEPNRDSRYAGMEKELLEKLNSKGLGPGGLGGLTTALAVNIEYFPTHIASIPVVVNLCCHASRHASCVI